MQSGVDGMANITTNTTSRRRRLHTRAAGVVQQRMMIHVRVHVGVERVLGVLMVY
jgi:hypothetical protein